MHSYTTPLATEENDKQPFQPFLEEKFHVCLPLRNPMSQETEGKTTDPEQRYRKPDSGSQTEIEIL
jgi:hypothetical protein